MMKNQNGQAAILIIFVLGMVSVLIGLSLTQTGFRESIMGRTEAGSAGAFYAANSGVEEAFIQIGRNEKNYSGSFDLNIGSGQTHVEVTGGTDLKTIKSTGTLGPYVRRLKVEVQNTSLKPGFAHAIHAGQGGFELRNTAVITGKNNTVGNVYSNNTVWGAKNDCSKNSASKVEGSVWAVEKITQLEKTDSGVCVMEDAYAGLLEYCSVEGDVGSPVTPSINCPYVGSWANSPAPDPLSLPEMGVDSLKNYLTARGLTWSGDCLLDGSGGPSDCSRGTKIIGDMIITGNLRKPSNANIKISGPVWVKKDVIFDSLGSVGLTADITEVSQIMVVDGTILSDSNVAFGSSGTAFLLFVSTFVPSIPEICDNPAITISSNTNSVLFYATKGCVLVNANSTFHGAILGEKIRVENNSTVEYDPALQTAIFGLTKSGGWQTISFKEE